MRTGWEHGGGLKGYAVVQWEVMGAQTKGHRGKEGNTSARETNIIHKNS